MIGETAGRASCQSVVWRAESIYRAPPLSAVETRLQLKPGIPVCRHRDWLSLEVAFCKYDATPRDLRIFSLTFSGASQRAFLASPQH